MSSEFETKKQTLCYELMHYFYTKKNKHANDGANGGVGTTLICVGQVQCTPITDKASPLSVFTPS